MNQLEINQDILDINEAINRFKSASEMVGYANGSIDQLCESKDATSNIDDRDAFDAQIIKTSESLDSAKDSQAQAREDIKRAFEHYYS